MQHSHPPTSSLPLPPSTHALLPSNLLLCDTVHSISSCSNHPERYSMNNSGLVLSCSPSQQTPETIFYDTPITKKQHVSSKYDSSGNQPLCHCHSLSHQVWSGWVTMVWVCGGVPTPENLGNIDALRLIASETIFGQKQQSEGRRLQYPSFSVATPHSTSFSFPIPCSLHHWFLSGMLSELLQCDVMSSLEQRRLLWNKIIGAYDMIALFPLITYSRSPISHCMDGH